MHEVLTTRVPWAGFSEAERVLALQRGENLDAALLPKDTPPSVAELIARCLALDRAARPRTAELLAVLEQAHENVVSGHFVRKRARACARTLSRVRRRWRASWSCACARARARRPASHPLTRAYRPFSAPPPRLAARRPPTPQDVFLSYAWGASSSRKPLADEVYRALRTAGLRVWMDEFEMGHDLHASMGEGIAKSDAVLMLVSPSYAASGPCMFEARAAAAAGKPLVTCCAEPGFWRSWGLAPDGSGVRALPDDHELVALARLKTHLFVDLGEASRVSWAAEGGVSAAERKKLALPEALPRLLELLAAARAAGARNAEGAAATSASASAPASAASASSAPSSSASASAARRNSAAAGKDPASAASASYASRASVSAAEAADASSGRASPEAAGVASAAAETAAAASAAAASAMAASTATAAATVAVWTRHRDGADVWYVSAAGESAWELPAGAEAVDAEFVSGAPDAAAEAAVEREATAAEVAVVRDAAGEGAAAPGAEAAPRKRLKGKVVKNAAAAASAPALLGTTGTAEAASSSDA